LFAANLVSEILGCHGIRGDTLQNDVGHKSIFCHSGLRDSYLSTPNKLAISHATFYLSLESAHSYSLTGLSDCSDGSVGFPRPYELIDRRTLTELVTMVSLKYSIPIP
jgi:hypothetical protein